MIVGRVLGGHGIDGTLRVEIITHFPERLPQLRHLYLGAETTARPVRRVRLAPPYAFIQLAGLTTPEAAQASRGQLLRIDHEQAVLLPAGEYFHWQIIGASVSDETGQRLGIVAEIIETGANDVYVVRSAEGAELLLPAIAEVIRRIDTERGLITVRLLPGLSEWPPTSGAADGAEGAGSDSS